MTRKRLNKKRYPVVVLSALLLMITGCTPDVPPQLSSDHPVDENSAGMVLLAVNQYTEDGYESKIEYEYNKKGQMIRETNSFTYEDDTSVEVYDLTYDDAGRLIRKTRSSGDSGYSSDDLERKYDASGNMIAESSFKTGDYWHDISYTYDSDNRVEKEVWSVDYMGDGSDPDVLEYHHSYSERSDGTVVDKRQLIQDGKATEETTYIYDSSGRLLQGYDDYWAVPIQYDYIEDKYFNIYTETEKIEDEEESHSTVAEILDTAGKSVDKIYLSDKPEFEYDSEGYLIKATDYYGLTELYYGKVGDRISENKDSENGTEKGTEQNLNPEKEKTEDKSGSGTVPSDLLNKLSGKKFVFSSGAGGWMTEIDMSKDGSFKGYYMDSNLGETGPDYPNGTTYESFFTGRFVIDKQIDEYTYSAKLKDLKTRDSEGKETIIEGEKRISAEPYGFETGTDFLFYAPGHPTNTLKTPFLEWINASAGSILQNGKLTVWGLYNVDPEYPMYEDSETDLVERMWNNQTSDDHQSAESSSKKSDDSDVVELSTPTNFKWEADEGGLPDAAGVRVTWDEVPGADGYESRFYLFWGDDDQVSPPDDTGTNSASAYFQDHTNIRVEVRAYRTVNGEKQYSAWGSDVIDEEDVYEL